MRRLCKRCERRQAMPRLKLCKSCAEKMDNSAHATPEGGEGGETRA